MEARIRIARRRQAVILACAVGLGAIVTPVSAQTAAAGPWSSEVSVKAGLGHVFRFEDRTFGNRPNIGAGAALRHRSGLGVEFDVDRTLGLTPSEAPCAIAIDRVPATCVGQGRNGVQSATAVSLRTRYEIGRNRVVRPYVSGGVGWLITRSVWAAATVRGNEVVLTEHEQRDVGIGPDLGAGVRVSVRDHLTVSPEVQWLEASARSGLNLAVTRASLRVSWSWW